MKRRFLTIFAAILIAASLASCGGGTEEESTSGNKININVEETTEEKSGNATTEEITEKQEETTKDQQGSVVDRNSDPGEFTYIDQNDWTENSWQDGITALNNDIIAASLDGEATLKTLKLNGKEPMLVPANPKYSEIYLEGKEVSILGVAIGVIKNYIN